MAVRELDLGSTRLRVEDYLQEPFWRLAERGKWEPEAVNVVENVCGPDVHFVDVGAWIGPMTLLAAASGSTVEAFEPDPVAREALLRNVELNPDLAERVTVHAEAVSVDGNDLVMYAGSDGLGDSTSSVVGLPGREEVRVPSVRASDLPHCDVLKIDVEGFEYDLLPHVTIRPTTVLLSTHSYPLLYRYRSVPRALRTIPIRWQHERNINVARRFAAAWPRARMLDADGAPATWWWLATHPGNRDLVLSQ